MEALLEVPVSILVMSLSTITYSYNLAIVGIQAGYLHADYYDVVVADLLSEYGREAHGQLESLAGVRGAYLDLFDGQPAVAQRLLTLLREGHYAGVELMARRHLRLDAGRALLSHSELDAIERPSDELFPRLSQRQSLDRPARVLCPAA